MWLCQVCCFCLFISSSSVIRIFNCTSLIIFLGHLATSAMCHTLDCIHLWLCLIVCPARGKDTLYSSVPYYTVVGLSSAKSVDIRHNECACWITQRAWYETQSQVWDWSSLQEPPDWHQCKSLLVLIANHLFILPFRMYSLCFGHT